jgi:hypothetical protein
MEGQIEGRDYVVAPHAISDPELGRKPYGAGDKVPWADAVKYGLVTEKDRLPDPDAPPAKGKRAKKGPAEDRARKKAEDR